MGAGGAAALPALAPKYVPAAITPQALSIEEAKLRRVEESIRIFVRVADPKFRQIVPMRYFNLMLSPAEVEAYTADYLEQSGPRADAARMLLRVVAVTARMTTEMEELKRSRNSRSIWKLHADSLVVLIDLAQRVAEAVDRLRLRPAADRPETQANSEPLRNSLDKLRERTDRSGEAHRRSVATRTAPGKKDRNSRRELPGTRRQLLRSSHLSLRFQPRASESD